MQLLSTENSWFGTQHRQKAEPAYAGSWQTAVIVCSIVSLASSHPLGDSSQATPLLVMIAATITARQMICISTSRSQKLNVLLRLTRPKAIPAYGRIESSSDVVAKPAMGRREIRPASAVPAVSPKYAATVGVS